MSRGRSGSGAEVSVIRDKPLSDLTYLDRLIDKHRSSRLTNASREQK